MAVCSERIDTSAVERSNALVAHITGFSKRRLRKRLRTAMTMP